MMTPQEIIRRLWDLGHFRNPAHPTGVVEADLPKLKLTDRSVSIAMASYQEFMAVDFDRFSAVHHNRPGVCDGDLGPATMDLLNMERCGEPDYQMSVEEATGRGSWPANCHPDWPGVHTFTVQVDKSRMPSFLGDKNDPNSLFEQCFAMQRAAYADMGIVFIREDQNSKANTLVTWQRGAGWIGLAIVPNQFSCGLRIWARFDTVYQPGKMFDQWARLLCHEFGHNMGMSHSRGGIMNPSISSGVFTSTAWRGDPSEPILKRSFGGEPVAIGGPKPPPVDPPVDPKPPTDPPPAPGRVYFGGSVIAMVDGVSIGEYILTPKPRL
jgi:hypothetical protein